jgi:hypothetical protein
MWYSIITCSNNNGTPTTVMFAQVQQSVVQGHIADADLACDKQLLQLTAAAAAGKKGKGKGAGAGAGGGGGGPSLASLQQARVRTQLLGAVADMDTKLEAVARDDHTDAVHGHGSHHEAAAAALRCVQDYAAAEGTCVALMAGRLEAAAASLGALREEAADCHTLGMAAEAEGLEETAAQMERVLVDDEAAVMALRARAAAVCAQVPNFLSVCLSTFLHTYLATYPFVLQQFLLLSFG